MKWNAFRSGNQLYNLEHLDPFDWIFEIPGEKGRPSEKYKFHVLFSNHVFTSKPESGNADPDMFYESPDRSKREFDLERYELSKGLRSYIESMGERTCSHTSHSNFLRIEFVDDRNGKRREYEIYFNVSKSEPRGWLRMLIESAYVRDENRMQSRPKTRNIKLRVIARNVLRGKQIKKPK